MTSFRERLQDLLASTSLKLREFTLACSKGQKEQHSRQTAEVRSPVTKCRICTARHGTILLLLPACWRNSRRNPLTPFRTVSKGKFTVQISKVLVKRPSRRRSFVAARPDTLLDRAVCALCQHLHQYTAQDFANLPTDVCQRLLDELVRTNQLDLASLELFRGQAIWSLSLVEYPSSVSDAWIEVLHAAQLRRVKLANTDQASLICQAA